MNQMASSCSGARAGDLGDEGGGALLGGGEWEAGLSDRAVQLDPELLPFPRGRFSFGVGVTLKMAVSRWTNWAADVGLREENMGAEEGCAPGVCLCPCYRG